MVFLKNAHQISNFGHGVVQPGNEIGRLGIHCDQIGRIFQVLGDKFLHKSSQNIWRYFWAILKTSF